jgi:hypothetical protein
MPVRHGGTPLDLGPQNSSVIIVQGNYRGRELCGEKHGHSILALISLFIAARAFYNAVTIRKTSPYGETIRNAEILLYTCEILPMVLAVILYATPGLIPYTRRKIVSPRNGDIELARIH